MRRASMSSFREGTGLLQLRKGQDAREMIDDAEHSVADTRVRGSWWCKALGMLILGENVTYIIRYSIGF